METLETPKNYLENEQAAQQPLFYFSETASHNSAAVSRPISETQATEYEHPTLFAPDDIIGEKEQSTPLERALSEAKSGIPPFVLKLIDRCEELAAAVSEDGGYDNEKRMMLYDAKAAVRGCAEKLAATIETELTRDIYKIGTTSYLIIEDPHAKAGNRNWLIMLAEDKDVSFREPRGLQGDDEFAFGDFDAHVRLLTDILIETSAN